MMPTMSNINAFNAQKLVLDTARQVALRAAAGNAPAAMAADQTYYAGMITNAQSNGMLADQFIEALAEITKGLPPFPNNSYSAPY